MESKGYCNGGSMKKKYLTIDEFDEFVNNRVKHIEKTLFKLDIKLWVIVALLGIVLFIVGYLR